MLVLSRKLDQSITIAGEIRVTVLRIDRHGVRLGIEAPSHVGIVREELLLRPRDLDPELAALCGAGEALAASVG